MKKNDITSSPNKNKKEKRENNIKVVINLVFRFLTFKKLFILIKKLIVTPHTFYFFLNILKYIFLVKFYKNQATFLAKKLIQYMLNPKEGN